MKKYFPNIVIDAYMFASLPIGLTLLFRGLLLLIGDDSMMTVTADKFYLLKWLPVEVSYVVWILTGLMVLASAFGWIKPIWAQALVRGLAMIVLLDLELYANYVTFFVPGTPFLIGALTAHWAITITWVVALLVLPVRKFSTN